MKKTILIFIVAMLVSLWVTSLGFSVDLNSSYRANQTESIRYVFTENEVMGILISSIIKPNDAEYASGKWGIYIDDCSMRPYPCKTSVTIYHDLEYEIKEREVDMTPRKD